MHYRLVRPDDAAAGSILAATLDSLKMDMEMQADLARLSRACCQPERFVARSRCRKPQRARLGRRLQAEGLQVGAGSLGEAAGSSGLWGWTTRTKRWP